MASHPVKGLVALVTGGASGLGLATVERLIKHGASIVLCDLPNSKGNSVAQRFGEKCVFVPTDITSQADIKNAVSVTESKFKKLNAVVNCAGTSLISKTYDFEQQKPHPLDTFIKLHTVNTLGTANVINHAIELMSKNAPDDDGQKGVIVNASSISAYEGSQGHVAYSSACGAIVSMTRPLAVELASKGIRCCTIATGLFDTPSFRSLPEKYRRYLPSIVTFPKGLGNPEEFAHLVETIIDIACLNGEVIRLDGALRLSI